ncbi:unnamed protein product [Caenorhabditis sp. 36 PRJEB53466]|nr:unnamed protein product [Caenorhabditis sp. 36 PRJEB53466]
MLTIPKTPKKVVHREKAAPHRTSPPRFRLDSLLNCTDRTSANSVGVPCGAEETLSTVSNAYTPHPIASSTPFRHVFKQSQKDAILVTKKWPQPRTETAPSPIRLISTSCSKSITLSSGSEPELNILNSSTDGSALCTVIAAPSYPKRSPLIIKQSNMDNKHQSIIVISSDSENSSFDMPQLPPRPDSEPLFGYNEKIQKRPMSVDQMPSRGTFRPSMRRRQLKMSTFSKTPRCARPTKAWLARTADPKDEEPIESIQKKTKMTAEEREEVWKRLLAPPTSSRRDAGAQPQ